MTRTCIIVSPYFPPSTLAGVHRARHLAKYLPAAGWWPIIVCVNEIYHEERLDPGLAALVPSSVEIVKVPALSPRYCRPLGFGEISLRAWWPLRQAVLGLLARRRVDVVLITGSPYYPMLLTAEIKRRFSVPVVLDFQDPWVSNWGAQQSRWSKLGVAHRLAAMLEPRVVHGADFVTSVSDRQNDDLATKYPEFDRSRMAAIPIGFDADDFNAPWRDTTVSLPQGIERGRVNLSYIGTVWPAVIETVSCLLKAVRRIRDENPAIYARLRLNFVGTTSNPNGTTGSRVLPLALAEGVGDAVYEIPQRLPYLEALAIQANSDGILMLGSNEPHYTASKIYPGLMSGRPYVSLFHRASSSHRILSSAGGGIALSFNDEEDLRALVPAIAQALCTLAVAPDQLGCADPRAYAPYEARAVAEKYADVFRKASRV
jgi:glycosyltransferase involved in cell wall biosynthesis